MTIVTRPTGSERYVVDSSGWLEYVTEDSKVELFAPYIEGEKPVVVPTIVIYEVYRHLVREHGESVAQQFFSQALRNQVFQLDVYTAIAAAELGLKHKLAMADAIIYATARASQAELVTSDVDFAGLPGVMVL